MNFVGSVEGDGGGGPIVVDVACGIVAGVGDNDGSRLEGEYGSVANEYAGMESVNRAFCFGITIPSEETTIINPERGNIS